MNVTIFLTIIWHGKSKNAVFWRTNKRPVARVHRQVNFDTGDIVQQRNSATNQSDKGQAKAEAVQKQGLIPGQRQTEQAENRRRQGREISPKINSGLSGIKLRMIWQAMNSQAETRALKDAYLPVKHTEAILKSNTAGRGHLGAFLQWMN